MTDAKPPGIDPASKAATLAAALPFMRRYAGKTIVVKYGGHAMGDEHLADLFAQDVVLLKQIGMNPVVVHGGGPQIGQMLDRLKIKSSFIDGLRVTDRETVEIVEMVLSGSINKQLVSAINGAGGYAIGLSGKDANLIRARKLTRERRESDSHIEKVLDLGFVGEPEAINTEVLQLFERSAIIPVIAPIGVGTGGETYNINADTAAGAECRVLMGRTIAQFRRQTGLRTPGDNKNVTDGLARETQHPHTGRPAGRHVRRPHFPDA